MKQIEAIIRTEKFEAVKDALHDVGIEFFTYFDVKSVGKESSSREYRGTIYDAGYIARVMLKIVVIDENVATAVDTIVTAASTGEVGDGQVYVMPVEDCIRIRDNQKLHSVED